MPIWTFHGRLKVGRLDSTRWKILASCKTKARFLLFFNWFGLIAAYTSESQLRQLVSKEGISCEGSCVLPTYHAVAPSNQDITNVMALLGVDFCKSSECVKLQEAEKLIEDRGILMEVRPLFCCFLGLF